MAQETITESHSNGTTRGRNDALNKFRCFTSEILQSSIEEVMRQIAKKEYEVYEALRDFAEYMCYTNVSGTSQRTYMTHIRQYIVAETDLDITKEKFHAKVNPFMVRVHRIRDGELSSSDTARIISAMPEKMKLVCMLQICTLRRPREINYLRVCDLDFSKEPTEISVPASVSKNNTEGRTFCTAETTKMLQHYIEKNKLRGGDRLFAYASTQSMDIIFQDNLRRQLPDLCKRMKKSRRLLNCIHALFTRNCRARSIDSC